MPRSGTSCSPVTSYRIITCLPQQQQADMSGRNARISPPPPIIAGSTLASESSCSSELPTRPWKRRGILLYPLSPSDSSTAPSHKLQDALPASMSVVFPMQLPATCASHVVVPAESASRPTYSQLHLTCTRPPLQTTSSYGLNLCTGTRAKTRRRRRRRRRRMEERRTRRIRGG
eukprot:753145-Hanusia_phi.AAC.2